MPYLFPIMPMNTLYSIDAVRTIEKSALASLPTGTLMRRAGKAASDLAKDILAGIPDNVNRILVLAGPGNNGGDALEMAANLADEGFHVSVLLVLNRKNPSEEAKQAMQKAVKSAVHWEDALSIGTTFEKLQQQTWSLVVDGIFGIGLLEGLSGNLKKLVDLVNNLNCPALALDVPSGLDADTGTIVGTDMTAVKATHTITFIGDKPGLHTAKGRDYAGKVHLATLDVARQHFIPAVAHLNSPDLFRHFLKPRPHDSHKGTYGRLAIVGGDEGMGGALTLASRAALMLGTGLCYAVYLKNAPTIDPICPEAMLRSAHRFDFSSDVLAIGPGLGRSNVAREYLQRVLTSDRPVVLDADALNNIAEDNDLEQLLMYRKPPAIITPHPLEAARLLKTDAVSIQQDRIESAKALAVKFNAIAVLKGSGTIIAKPDGQFAVNPTGNPGLATAGTGDVLTGMTGSLLAQGWTPFEAALGAVWLHGKAADNIAENLKGYTGILAGELAPVARTILNTLITR